MVSPTKHVLRGWPTCYPRGPLRYTGVHMRDQRFLYIPLNTFYSKCKIRPYLNKDFVGFVSNLTPLIGLSPTNLSTFWQNHPLFPETWHFRPKRVPRFTRSTANKTPFSLFFSRMCTPIYLSGPPRHVTTAVLIHLLGGHLLVDDILASWADICYDGSTDIGYACLLRGHVTTAVLLFGWYALTESFYLKVRVWV